MSERLTPKYLTKEVAETAVEMVLKGFVFDSRMDQVIDGHNCHIVVLVPSVEDARLSGYPNWPHYPITPVCIYEKSTGDTEKWSYPFKQIASCKAMQLWRARIPTATQTRCPISLFPDDTPYWGGVNRHGIVVACSGFQGYFDQMISGMIADAIKAFARFHFENSDDVKKELSFLG
ncbi:MAG: hypothetical protein R3B69_04510 [Candidatus Paceibacterota bacterium]